MNRGGSGVPEVEVVDRETIEAMWDMSAEAMARPKEAGKARADGRVGWYGVRAGGVCVGPEGACGSGRACE
jgi:hypothetical protein